MVRQVLWAVAAAGVLATPAAAQTPWSVSFNLGADVALSGDVHGAGTGRVLALPTTVEARGYDEVYGNPFTWSLDFGYEASGGNELRVRLFRTAGAAERVQVGNVAGLALFAEFDDYAATGVDFGYRKYLGPGGVRPFVGGSVGFVRAGQNDGTFTVPAAGVTLADVPMTDSSTAATFALSGGVMVPMGSTFGIQAGVDFRWHGDLEPIDGLAGTGLEAINDETRRWSMPITVGAVIRF
jgi:hypothetical protein